MRITGLKKPKHDAVDARTFGPAAPAQCSRRTRCPAWLALHLRPFTAVDQEQEPGRAGGETRSRRGLGQGATAMKKMLLPSVAALLLATGTAHADNEKWEASFRQCHIHKWFSKDELAAIGWARETEGQTIVIEPEEIPDILKAIGVIKKCKAFYQCLEDRDRGKVKHCYENDRRWR
jgi:hypothetical protein